MAKHSFSGGPDVGWATIGVCECVRHVDHLGVIHALAHLEQTSSCCSCICIYTFSYAMQMQDKLLLMSVNGGDIWIVKDNILILLAYVGYAGGFYVIRQ